jgi:outer membrane protein TolC
MKISAFLSKATLFCGVCAIAACASDPYRPASSQRVTETLTREYERFLSSDETRAASAQSVPDDVNTVTPMRDAGGAAPIALQSTETLPKSQNAEAPWWDERARTADRAEGERQLDIPTLFREVLANNSQIKVFSELPLIRRTAVEEARGAYDTEGFAEVEGGSIDEPVGDTLRTGGPDRFEEDFIDAEIGVRQPLITGGEVTVSQTFGRRDNNSVFFVPNPQSSSQLELEYTQPLLRGAWLDRNRAPIRIAQIDQSIAEDELSRQVSNQLAEAVRSYWNLYLARVRQGLREDAVAKAQGISEQLEARRDVDTLSSELARATSELRTREASLVRARAAVRNAEDRLLTFLGDMGKDASFAEIVPVERPVNALLVIDEAEAGLLALQHRPEIAQAIKQVEAAEFREDIAQRDRLPGLDLVVRTYVAGIADDDFGEPLGDQFSEGNPSVIAGLRLTVPFRNRAAEARYDRRRLETRQVENQLRVASETVLLEARIAAREVRTAFDEAMARRAAMEAASQDVRELEERATLGTGGAAGAAYLDQLLRAQERQTAAQDGFATAMTTYQVALFNLERATGQILRVRDVEPTLVTEDGPGQYRFQTTGGN